MPTRSALIATAATLGLLLPIGCSDDDSAPDGADTEAAGTEATGNDTSPSTGASTATTTPSTTTGSSSETGSTSEDTETGTDGSESSGDPGTDTDGGPGPVDDLEDWPQLYQDFITEAGGSKFVDVGDAVMHYVETGPADGEPVLLVHGIPTQAFLWRDVMPELTGKRVIAIDLIGYGRSERPEGLPYTPAMQVEFLDAFADELGLEGVHLVVQDLGGPVGLRWASENPDQVASITMFETLWSTLPGLESLPPDFAMLIGALRTDGVGEMMVAEQAVFLNALDGLTFIELPEDIQEVYRHPWQEPQDRVDVFLPSGPRAFPFPDDPVATAFVGGYQEYLSTTDTPKLVIDIFPGVLSNLEVAPSAGGDPIRNAQFAATEFPNIELVELQNGAHFAQEDIPVELGETINGFIDDLE
ncbi:MAG: alpha/beta fold hydrolase [Nannocystales bacterium]